MDPRAHAASAGAGDSGAHATFLGTRTFGSLDGLRAIAILVVVWHHAALPVAGWRVTGRGFLGVDLFFVISGFLIVTLLLRERRRTGTISLRGFYVRRFLRIFPPFYLMLAVVGATALLKRGHGSADVLRDLPFAAFYVSNLVPMSSMLAITWSLSVEEQFYLVVPAVVRYAHRALKALLPAAYVAASLPALGALPGVALPAFFRETTFGPILLGVMLALVLDDRRGYEAVRRALGGALAPAGALGLVVVAASYPADDISGWPRIAMHWTILILVAACVVRERHVLHPLLASWPMRRIGVVSYGIYLYHLIAMHFVSRGLERVGIEAGLLRFAATALLAWAAAEASYALFESRFLAMKARLARAAPHPASRAATQPGG